MKTKKIKENKLHGQFSVTLTLILRHLKMFFKNKLTFIFSLMVPVLTLVIYALFLRDLEIGAVSPMITEYFTDAADQKVITDMVGGVVDAWMLSGIIAISCITVSLNSCYIMIQDREQGVNKDFTSSPISKWSIRISYYLFNCIVTFIITFILLLICIVYLSIVGGMMLSIVDFLAILGTLILSIISASFFALLIASFVNEGSIYNSIMAITSAAIGFLIGGYMPLSMLPQAAQYVCIFLPGTYSAGILRNLFLRGQIETLENAIDTLSSATPEAHDLIPTLKDQFLDIKFFDLNLNMHYMFVGLILTTLIIVIIHLSVQSSLELRALVGAKPKRKKKKE